MLDFADSLGNKRALEFSLSYNDKYINLTLCAAKNTNCSTVQMPYALLEDIIDNLINLRKEHECE